jgi:hypothetical protein
MSPVATAAAIYPRHTGQYGVVEQSIQVYQFGLSI